MNQTIVKGKSVLNKTKTYRNKAKGGYYLVFSVEDGAKLSEALAGVQIVIYYRDGAVEPYARTLLEFCAEFEEIDDDDFALPLKTQNNYFECRSCQ
ncbi:MAG: hypothetical protein LBI57_06100 [Helicobacteraceae bacterium]|jgi:hypothetical protein|nr:hypothetical protein [Helicobacteraceae bacterium]